MTFLNTQKSLVTSWAKNTITPHPDRKVSMQDLYVLYCKENNKDNILKSKTFATILKRYLKESTAKEIVHFDYKQGSVIFGIDIKNNAIMQ